MKNQRTIYHVIVDRSGSMTSCIDSTINGFNDQLSQIQSMEKEFLNQEILVGLTLFNDRISHIKILQPLSVMSKLDRVNYVPEGSTALLDAIGQTTTLLEERQGNLPGLPTSFVMVILTDGHENSSRSYNLEQVRTLIQKLEATGKWTFSFIGATLDAVYVAEQMSIKAQNSFTFNKASMKEAVWDKLSYSMRGYFSKKEKGENPSSLF
jgi:hypothetical protein